MSISKFITALSIAVASQASHAVVLSVNSYTASSITFTLTGPMPSGPAGALINNPREIDIRYGGGVSYGADTFAYNTLSASPFEGAGSYVGGYTGGFFSSPTAPADNYSYLQFENNLSGLSTTGQSITVNFMVPSPILNTRGSGTIDLYWGSAYNGPDPAGQQNLLRSSVRIINGQVVANDDVGSVPEPKTVGLFGIAILGMFARRRTGC